MGGNGIYELQIMNTQTNIDSIKKILEGLLFAAHEPLSLEQLAKLLTEDGQPSFDKQELRTILVNLATDYLEKGIELKEIASGFRFQVREELKPWVSKLWAEKPPRYSSALLEILALIAYRQPITRGEIEEIRGVTLSSNIMQTLQEREWIAAVGYKDVPGRPALYATTKKFLDYFNLTSLADLPILDDSTDNSLTADIS